MAHLNHGSFGAVPRMVLAAQSVLRERIEANPDRFFSRELGRLLVDARQRAAEFLNADPEGLAWVENATTGVNAVLGSVELGPGDEILTTDHAYGAVLLSARERARRSGAALRVAHVALEEGGKDAAAELLSAVSERTRIVIVDQITSPTALRLPVAALSGALRERGVLCLVDGAHAPGMIPVDLAGLDPDFWVGNFHKWAFAPRGAAALYVREELRDSVRPPVTSHLIDLGFPLSFHFTGTRDYTPFLCVPAGLAFLEELGARRLRDHNRGLVLQGRDVVADALGAGLAYPDDCAEDVSMSLLPLPDGVAKDQPEAQAFMALLAEELRAEVAVSVFDGRSFLRLSAQAYNSFGEYETLAKGLAELVGAG